MKLIHPTPNSGPHAEQELNNESPVPDVAKNVLRAFQYCLKSEKIDAHTGMDLAALMLELASLHQYGALQQDKPELATALDLHLSECKLRIQQLSSALNLHLESEPEKAAT